MRPCRATMSGDERLHRLLVADVGGGALGFAAIFRDLGRNLVELRFLAADETTVAPRLASSCAVQRPMPLPPPVTMWTCPSKRPGRKILR